MKIKDIINEVGLATGLKSFAKGLVTPKSFQSLPDFVPRGTGRISDPAAAEIAYQRYGDAPGAEGYGASGWLPDEYQARKKQEILANKARNQKSAQKLMKDLKITNVKSSEPASEQPAPPQVRLPNGEIITKYGNDWYDDNGERISLPGDVERLERMRRGPSGQAQMQTTKNIPVDLPGYTKRGKR